MKQMYKYMVFITVISTNIQIVSMDLSTDIPLEFCSIDELDGIEIPPNHFYHAQQAFNKKDYVRARSILEESYSTLPSNHKHWSNLLLGDIYENGRNVEKNTEIAINHFKQATDQEDSDFAKAAAHYRLGLTYSKDTSKYKKAQKQFNYAAQQQTSSAIRKGASDELKLLYLKRGWNAFSSFFKRSSKATEKTLLLKN